MFKYEKIVIFTSLMFLPSVNCALECFLPLIDQVLILGDSTVGLPTPPTRLVVSTSLCIYILLFMLLCEISGPMGTQNFGFVVNTGHSHWDNVSTCARHNRIALITHCLSQRVALQLYQRRTHCNVTNL